MKRLLSVALLGVSALSFAQSPGDTYIIETTTPGLNLADYTANGMTVSTARVDSSLFPELTAARTQSAYCTLAILNKTPKFTPSALPGPGLYKIEYCYPNVSSINAPSVTWTVETEPGVSLTGTIDQQTATANTWVQIGGPAATFALDSDTDSFLQFDTSTANGGVAASGQRFYIDAVKFTYMAPLPPEEQVVTVSGTVGATGPSDFEFLGQALDSFRVGGANAGNPLPNVIRVTGSATGGVVQLASGSPAVYSLKDTTGAEYEDITIIGHDGTASARRTVLIGNESGTVSDGLDIATNADLTFENLNFIPQLSHTWTDDMITIDGAVPGSVAFVFRNCYLGPNNGSNAPADVTGQTAGTIGAGGLINDDVFTVFPDAGEDVNFTLENCVVHAAGIGGTVDGDGIVIAPNATAPNAGSYNFVDTVFSYNDRLGVQCSGDAGDSVNVSGCILVQNGQGTPASFGNGWYTFNLNAATMSVLQDTIMAQNHDRNLSLNGTPPTDFTKIDGSIFSDTKGGAGANLSAVLSANGAGVKTIEVSNSTFHNTNNGTVVFVADDPITMDNVIIAGAGGTETGISTGATNPAITITNSAIVTEGPNALGTAINPALTNVTQTKVIPHTPDFAQTTNPFAADYFDVRNPTYETAGPAGGQLTGGGDYVGGGVPVTLSGFAIE